MTTFRNMRLQTRLLISFTFLSILAVTIVITSLYLISVTQERNFSEIGLQTILIVIAAGAGISFIGGIIIAQSFIKPMANLIEIMRRLVEEEGEVNVLYTNQDNELGDMARALEVFKKNVAERERLENIQAEQAEKVIRYAQEAARAKEMKVALDKERELSELQRQFISMASHEFRTPLAIIDLAVQKLSRRAKKDQLTPDGTLESMGKIRNAVQRMTRLMESTLVAARMEAGKIQITIEPCDIHKLLVDICTSLDEVSERHDIRLNAVDLPETIMADTPAVGQIVSNLLANAVKYAPDSPDIEVNAHEENDQVIISVTDYGLGIDKEDLKNIGERFFRAKTSTGIAGTGIGLNLVKALVEEHEGSFSLESELGKGSTFTISLPIEGPAQEEKKPAEMIVA